MTNEATLDMDWPELLKRLIELILPRSDDILFSPAKLGALLTICAEFAELEPIVRERASTLALQKHEIPGWTLVHRDGHRYVETDTVIELALACPACCLALMVSELGRQLGHISEAKYELLCEAAGRLSDSAVIKQAGATVFLRRNPN
jgi:hypothetical protein